MSASSNDNALPKYNGSSSVPSESETSEGLNKMTTDEEADPAGAVTQ